MPVCSTNSPPLIHIRTACINRNFVRDAPQDLIIVMIELTEMYAPLGETSFNPSNKSLPGGFDFHTGISEVSKIFNTTCNSTFYSRWNTRLTSTSRRGGSLSSSALTRRLTVCSCTDVPSCLLTCPPIVLLDLPFLSGICRSIFQSAAACKNA